MRYFRSESVVKNIKRDILFYSGATLFFALGIVIGSIGVKVLDMNSKKELVIYLNRFFQIMDKEGIKNASVFYQALKMNFQTVFFIWLLSITVIGIPVTLFIISFRGFIIGFTVAFFIEGMGWKGVLLTIVAILPQNIIYIPCVIGISALSLKFSINVLKRNLKGGVITHYKNSIFSYTIFISVIFLIMFLGTIIEAYLTPVFIKAIAGYIIMQ